MKSSVQKQLEAGFALPIAIGVGVIMILIATTMIIRSNQSQIASISQRSSNQSLAAAESGTAQFLSLFNKYRVFAAETTGTSSTGWDNLRTEIRALPGCSNFAQANYDPTSPDYDLEANILDTIIADFNAEINVDPQNPEKGSYQLKSYEVIGSEGVLKIRGTASDTRDTSITDLEVKLPVDEKPIDSTTTNSPAQGCGDLATSLAATASNALPINNFSALEGAITASSIPHKINVSPDTLKNQTLPLSSDPNGTTYILNGDLSLTGSETITVENDKMVFLVTASDITVAADKAIQTKSNASLFIISYGNVSIRGDTEQPILYDPTNNIEDLLTIPLHIFLAGEGTIEIETPSINHTADIPIVAYAPFGDVTLNLIGSSASNFKGEVWAKNFQTKQNDTPQASKFSQLSDPAIGSNPLRTVDALPSQVSFWKNRLDISQFPEFKIRPINSWKRENTP